jgi:hypothetical protein
LHHAGHETSRQLLGAGRDISHCIFDLLDLLDNTYAVSTWHWPSEGGKYKTFWHSICGRYQNFDITFQKTVPGSTHNMWSTVIKKREGLAHTSSLRKLRPIQRDQFECRYLLSKRWYCTQVLAITSEAVRHINAMITWFIWKVTPVESPYPLCIFHTGKRDWDSLILGQNFTSYSLTVVTSF